MKKHLPKLDSQDLIKASYLAFLDELAGTDYSGDILTSYGDRLTFATDNSIYQLMPQGVLHPKTSGDLSIIVQLAHQKRHGDVKLFPRGGGTGTNGQSLGSGLVVDVSKYMNKILEVNVDEGYVKVEPGVVLDQLNKRLKPHGYFFAPNLSPSSRATLGGMCSTDACGKGSRIYGRTSEHIIDLELVLSDGSRWRSKDLDSQEFTKVSQRPDLVGRIHKSVGEVVTNHRQEIEDRFPKMSRFLTGYNLAKVFDDKGGFTLNYLISGSEGTLAFLTGMTLKLTPLPKATELVMVKYDSFDAALRGAHELVNFDPLAIETIDDTILELAKGDILWHKLSPFFVGDQGHVAAINLIEFSSQTMTEAQKKASMLKAFLDEANKQDSGIVGYIGTTKPEEIATIWELRKKGVGLLGKRPGNRRPIPFVEDTAVPPEHLADYIREFRGILESHGLEYGMFGHVDVGCLHVRPALDLKDAGDEAKVRQISDAVEALVRKYNGIMWAEHGRGFRSEYTERIFGPKLYKALGQVKAAFDPQNTFNPGKMVSPDASPAGVVKLDEAPMRGQSDRVIAPSTREAYPAAMNCNGNGACFHFDADYVMCPSMKVSRNRLHSPKGRASLMREWLGQLAGNGVAAENIREGGGRQRADSSDYSHEVYKGMAGCLSCKACRTQCPIQVDIPELKSRFLAAYHSRYRRPIFDYIIGMGESLHYRMRWMAPLYNMFVATRLGQAVLRKVTGMVSPPSLSFPPLDLRLKKAGIPRVKPGDVTSTEDVILVPDAMTMLYEAPLVMTVVTLMKNLGVKVSVAPFKENGKGLHVKGFRRRFKRVARRQSDLLRQLSRDGAQLVCLDPAIALTYREEYPDLLGPQKFEVHMIHEWLMNYLISKPLGAEFKAAGGGKFALFSHCGEQTSGASKLSHWQSVFERFGHELKIISVGCCGMAGAYGHQDCHQKDSQGVYNLSWQPHVEQVIKDGFTPLATGASCRTQVERFSYMNLMHPLEALAGRLS